MMDKGLLGFILVFIILIAAGIYQGNVDQIAPVVAQAQADLSLGAAPVQVITNGAAWLLKLIGGAAFTGFALAAFSEFKKFYKTWTRNNQMKRWQPGPNAQWRDPGRQQPKTPSLTRADLMLLALAGKDPLTIRNRSGLGVKRSSDDENDIDLEF